jgi:hypothetical protein
MEIRPLRETDAAAIRRSLLRDPEIAARFRSTGPFTLGRTRTARGSGHDGITGAGIRISGAGNRLT